MSFITEKAIEELLQLDTRMVALPDGTIVPVAAMRHHWLAFAECIDYGWTEEKIIATAWNDAAETNRPFAFVLLGLIAYIQNATRDRFGSNSQLPALLSHYDDPDSNTREA